MTSGTQLNLLREARAFIRENFSLCVLGGKTEAGRLVDRIDAVLAEFSKAEGRS